jgi:hypothetical protein
MKRFFQFFANLFAGLVGKLLIVANFVICLFIFDWDKFIRYLETPVKINCHIKQSGGSIDFCLYGFSGYGYGIIESIGYFIVSIFLLLFGAFFFILVYPSVAVTEIILQILKAQFPLWCIETQDILYVPIFAVVNSFYWLFLGDMIEMAHSAYLRNKKFPKILSCFPDSK